MSIKESFIFNYTNVIADMSKMKRVVFESSGRSIGVFTVFLSISFIETPIWLWFLCITQCYQIRLAFVKELFAFL